ncbi:PREDICTED: transcription repressor OFP15-like [Ipomoea nil]|uniref:transcription repressor OFP15-like n=1 Tax=Ipomoea nil TaxID=35883 RepID=UPI000900DB53|nr:PREDICTED: transcription repressor OFP15-like [Ipomoea nil]
MGKGSWKASNTKRAWNPLSLFSSRNNNHSQLLWKWLIPKPFFSLHKNRLIQAPHNTHHRLAASPEWASPLLAQGEETLKIQVNQALASRRLSFELEESCSILATAVGFPFKECEVVAMETADPYRELVSSMEEMLEVYGVKGDDDDEGNNKLDWECLENLLAWYLRVNSNRIHDFIVSAFVDVCFSLLSSARDNNNNNNDNHNDNDDKHSDPS